MTKTRYAAPPVTPDQPLRGALWMLGSVVGFSAIAVSGRQIAPALDTGEMMFYRSLIGIPLVLGWAIVAGRLGEINTRRLPLHVLRNGIHFAGQSFWLQALALIPLASLFAIEFSSPVMVALAAPLVLGERLTKMKLGTALFGFFGILLVARPFSAAGLSAGMLLALVSAAAFATTAIVTKQLTRHASVICILFWLTIIQSCLAAVVAGHDGKIALPGPAILPWVLVMGVSGFLAHLGLTKALSLAPATTVVPVDFLRLPLIAVIGMLFYGEPLDIWVFVGGAIIFTANWLNIRAGARPRYTTV